MRSRGRLPPSERVKDAVKLLFGARIMGSELASICAQHHSTGQQCLPAGIGMKDSTVRIDEKQTGSNPVERVTKQGRFRLTVIHQIADEHCAPQVRYDEPHTIPYRLAFARILAVAPENQLNQGRGGFIEACLPAVDKALRLHPLRVETALHILAVRDEIGCASHLADITQQQRLRGRIELCVMLYVCFQTGGFDSECMDTVD